MIVLHTRDQSAPPTNDVTFDQEITVAGQLY